MGRFATIIRKAIERDGRTIYAISKQSGVNSAVVGRFVKGERGLTLDTAERLCEVLDLDLCERRKTRRR